MKVRKILVGAAGLVLLAIGCRALCSRFGAQMCERCGPGPCRCGSGPCGRCGKTPCRCGQEAAPASGAES